MSLDLPARDGVKVEPPESQGWAMVAGTTDPSGVLWRFAELQSVMTDSVTNIAGIEIPSTDPTFLIVVSVHILLGLGCTVAGIVAMLSQKSAGRHPRFGTVYFWSLVGVFVTMTGLAVVRWAEDYHLFILGLLSLAAAYLGREARRQRWSHWAQLHITGMGTSYILLLTAFYVDNGKSLPLWNQLPPIAYWLIPMAVGTPLIIRALFWHPLAR